MALNSETVRAKEKTPVEPQWAQPKTNIKHWPTDEKFYASVVLESEVWPTMINASLTSL